MKAVVEWFPIDNNTKLVYTIFVRKNTTLHQLFRDWLKRLVGRKRRAEEFRTLMNELRHVDAGRKFTRDEMNERG
jgi:hypothetical protein